MLDRTAVGPDLTEVFGPDLLTQAFRAKLSVSLYAFSLPQEQGKSLRTTNLIERLVLEFKRRVKTQCSLPWEKSAILILYGALPWLKSRGCIEAFASSRRSGLFFQLGRRSKAMAPLKPQKGPLRR